MVTGLSEYSTDFAPRFAELAPNKAATDDSSNDLFKLLLGLIFLFIELLACFLEVVQRAPQRMEIYICGCFRGDRFDPEEMIISRVEPDNATDVQLTRPGTTRVTKNSVSY